MPPVVTWLVTAISLLSFVGLAFVYLRGSADKGTMESQKRLIDSLTEELNNTNRKLAAVETRCGHLESERDTLLGVVTHAPEIASIQVGVTTIQTTLGELVTLVKGNAA